MSNLQMKHRLPEFDLKGPSVISNLQCYSCNPSPLSWWSSPPLTGPSHCRITKVCFNHGKKSQICILMTAVLHVKILVNTLKLRCQHSEKKTCSIFLLWILSYASGQCCMAYVPHDWLLPTRLWHDSNRWPLSSELTEPKIGHCC